MLEQKAEILTIEGGKGEILAELILHQDILSIMPEKARRELHQKVINDVAKYM